MAKPFVKWAGGKGKLLKTLEKYLPSDFEKQESITYIEPFVGGGAMLFHMLETFPNIRRVIINDINPELMLCYDAVKNNHINLIDELRNIEQEYFENDTQDARLAYYMGIRDAYNQLHLDPNANGMFEIIQKVSYFIFLNRTCFNGLYRENRNGNFNVPFGKYVHPIICNEEAIQQAHNALQGVELMNGDYHNLLNQINEGEYTFFYFDPPYRPLLGTKNFKEYTKYKFGDQQQVELRDFCNQVDELGSLFMLSNSDSERVPGINFFEEIYDGYEFHRVMAPRVINAFGAGRIPQSEVLITNYHINN